MVENDLVAVSEVEHRVMTDLVEGVEYILRRGKAEVAQVEPVLWPKMEYPVLVRAYAEHEGVTVSAAVERVVARSADHEVTPAVADQKILAVTAGQPVITFVPE